MPTYVDPAWLYIEYLDDSNPHSISVIANADTRLDTFSVYSGGAPYGTAWGSGRVSISGVPASAFNAQAAEISVEGCGSAAGVCAAAHVRSYVAYERTTTNGGVFVTWFSGEMASYPRWLLIEYLRRTYDVANGPGNTAFTFQHASTGLSYSTFGGSVTRRETLRWNTSPGPVFASTCEMTATYADETLERENTVTEVLECNLQNAIGGSGTFETEITYMAKSGYTGTTTSANHTGSLSASIP